MDPAAKRACRACFYSVLRAFRCAFRITGIATAPEMANRDEHRAVPACPVPVRLAAGLPALYARMGGCEKTGPLCLAIAMHLLSAI
jgi:hypothetical protein